MISIKIILDKRRLKKDNTYSLNYLLCHNRKTTTRYSGISIKETDWDDKSKLVKKSHPAYKALNIRLKKDLAEMQSSLILADENKIEEFLKPTKPEQITTKTKPTVFQFAQQLIDDLRNNNQIGNAWVYESTINALKLYYTDEELYFEELDYRFLTSYNTYLIKKELKPNSIYLYLRTLRIFYNKAINLKIADRIHYPFHDFKLKPAKTKKRAVEVSLLKKIVEIELPCNSMLYHARNFFLLSFCLIGISIVDLALLKKSNLRNGRITYQRRKTKKWYDIKVVPAASEILKQYMETESDYLLPIAPEIENEESRIRGIKSKTKIINKYLSKISGLIGLDQALTTYSSRHSWATIAKKAGYSIEIIAEALGHEQGNPTTNIYLDKFDQEVIDELNNHVVRLVLGNI